MRFPKNAQKDPFLSQLLARAPSLFSEAPQGPWYEVRASTPRGSEERIGELWIVGDIYPWWGYGAEELHLDLSTLRPFDRLDVHIYSRGGSVFEGLHIFEVLGNIGVPTCAFIEGLAASIASYIAMSCQTVCIGSGSQFMIHNPWGYVVGESKDFRKAADDMDLHKSILVKGYQRHSRLSPDEISAAMDIESWYSAEQALEAGFASEIREPAVALAAFAPVDLSVFAHAPKPVFGRSPAPTGTPGASTPPTPAADGRLIALESSLRRAQLKLAELGVTL